MDALNFAYWLQGLLELSPDTTTLNEEQVKMIREHLNTVFVKAPAPALPVWPQQGTGGAGGLSFPTDTVIRC